MTPDDKLFYDWLDGPDFRLSFSTLKKLFISPREFKSHIIQKLKNELPPPSDAMKLGSLVHCGITEPHKLETDFMVMPEFGRKKEDKAAKMQWIQDNPGPTHVSVKLKEKGENLAAIGRETAKDILPQLTHIEHIIITEIEGVPYKMLWDGSVRNGEENFEIKTTSERNPEWIIKTFYDYHYPIQAASYEFGGLSEWGKTPERTNYLIIQTVPPFGSWIVTATDEYLSHGREYLHKAINRFETVKVMDMWDCGEDMAVGPMERGLHYESKMRIE